MAETKPPIRLYPAVNGVLFDFEQRVLLTRRSPKVREPGKWCLPGGHVDPGESWISALRREMQEELGILVTGEKLIGIYSDPEVSVTKEVLWDGAYGHYVVATFLITEYEGEITTNDEVDLWDWFAPSGLPDPIVRSHPIRIEDAYRFEGESFVR